MVTWIDWDTAASRVVESVSWAKYRKVQVEVYRGGRGRWGDCMMQLDKLPDPLSRG
jgi:hypothetical protein